MPSAISPAKPFSIAIVGGGISGLSLALTLLEHNIPITIYEAASCFSEIGAGVAFGPNAGRAMEYMSPKIKQAFLKCRTGNGDGAQSNYWFTIRVGDARKADKDGYVKEGVKVGDPVFVIPLPNNGARGGVYRAHFLDELVKDIPDDCAKFHKRLVDMEEAADGSGDMVLKFADGSTAQHTAVIGCDGIKSMTRKWVLGRDNPASHAVFSGKYAYRGLIPMDKAVELLGDDAARNSQMYFGYHGHLLTFPIAHGKIMNVVAFSSRETWDDEKWVVTTSKKDMQADFADWGPHVQKIVEAMEKPDIWALFMHPPGETYTKGRVCLLGDAAHATTPHQGAGAGMCIEDACVISNLLKDANNTEDLMRAFSAYDKVRRERSQENVTRSFESGKMYEFELFGDDLDKIQETFLKKMDWVWGIDIEAHLAEARKIMKQEA